MDRILTDIFADEGYHEAVPRSRRVRGVDSANISKKLTGAEFEEHLVGCANGHTAKFQKIEHRAILSLVHHIYQEKVIVELNDKLRLMVRNGTLRSLNDIVEEYKLGTGIAVILEFEATFLSFSKTRETDCWIRTKELASRVRMMNA